MNNSRCTTIGHSANTATPTAPAACRVFSTADAIPERVLSTVANMPVVIAGTASPIPSGIVIKGINNLNKAYLLLRSVK